jgi:hypothetical protein
MQVDFTPVFGVYLRLPWCGKFEVIKMFTLGMSVSLNKKYIYLNGESWMVKGPNYSQKVRKFMFKTYKGNEEALQAAISWRDSEDEKITEREKSQIVLKSTLEEEQRKLRELQESDYRRLLEKERLELIEKRKKIDAEESAAWVAAEQKQDSKLWKMQQKDNFDYWKEKYPEEAATPDGIDTIRLGLIAAGMFGSQYIPTVDNIQKGYLARVALQKQVDQGVKLTIANVFKKNQIISYSK